MLFQSKHKKLLGKVTSALNGKSTVGSAAQTVLGLLLVGSYIQKHYVFADNFREYGKLLSSIDEIEEFKDAVEIVIRVRAKKKYGSDFDSGRNIEANTLLYGNLNSLDDMTLWIIQGFMAKYSVESLDDALRVCHLCNRFGVWNLELVKVEGNLVKQVAPKLTNQSDILDFASALTTYKALMMLSIALGMVPVETFEAAIKKRQADLAEEARRQKEESARASFAFVGG